jgi:hypothetical protein
MSAPDPIRRLREIAAEAADHELLADGPVTPDAPLLDLCAAALTAISPRSTASTNSGTPAQRTAAARSTDLSLTFKSPAATA